MAQPEGRAKALIDLKTCVPYRAADVAAAVVQKAKAVTCRPPGKA